MAMMVATNEVAAVMAQSVAAVMAQSVAADPMWVAGESVRVLQPKNMNRKLTYVIKATHPTHRVSVWTC